MLNRRLLLALVAGGVYWWLVTNGTGIPGREPPIAKDGLHVVIVSDAASRTPELATVTRSRLWQSIVEDAGGQWRIFDPADEPNDAAYAAAVEGVEPPAVIVSKRPGGGETRSLAGMMADDVVTLVRRYAE